MSTYYIVAYVIIGIFLLWTIISLFWNRVASPRYEVVEKRRGYQIRHYHSYIVAETVVDGGFKKSLYGGFRILASYIFGNNRKQRKVSMTAPVMQRSTSPTRQVISFVMPADYTMETLPAPNDSRVVVKVVEGHLVAALRFRGWGSTSRINSKRTLLEKKLIRDNVRMIGAISYAGYSRPGTIPFLGKNEVMVEIR